MKENNVSLDWEFVVENCCIGGPMSSNGDNIVYDLQIKTYGNIRTSCLNQSKFVFKAGLHLYFDFFNNKK